jgi:hypothetical protein
MGQVQITDNALWVKHVEDGEAIATRILDLKDNDPIVLNVDGKPVLFRKMRTGKDGRAVSGVRPDETFKAYWNDLLQKQRGKRLPIALADLPPSDPYLASIASLLSEWDSPADNAAYNDL